MIWPTLPAFSTANFLDHFDSTLDARWTSVTSGTGAVTITDSYLKCEAPANSAGFVYRTTEIDKTKSQLWLVCWAQQSTGLAGDGPIDVMLVNGASAPAADTQANYAAKTLVRSIFATGTPAESEIIYYDSGGTRQRWNPVTPAWQTAYAAARAPLRTDDYYITGLEIDGVNSRWRLMGIGQSFDTAGTYEFDQGWRLFYLTDWVTWANTRSNSNVWLILGFPLNNLSGGSTVETRVEWVRYAEALPGNTVLDSWITAKTSASASNHRLRHFYSYDGLSFLPDDRTTWALDLGTAGQPDDGEIERPRAVWDGRSTDWMFYTGYDGATRTVCLASATYARPQAGAFTRFGSNPIIPLGSSGQNDDQHTRTGDVVCDLSESDLNKRWKLLYMGFKVSDGKARIMYATAPTPTGPWTKRGTVIDVGGVGAVDEGACWDPVIVWYEGQWEVYYEAHTATDVISLRRATGTDLAVLTKDSADYTATLVSAKQALTANLTAAPGRTVTVASTTNFVKDGAVVIGDEDTNMDTYGFSRVRKVVNSTTLELYHGLTGFLTAAPPSKIVQRDAHRTRSPRAFVRVGNEWWFYYTFWDPWTFETDNLYGSLIEEIYLCTHAAASPSGATATLQHLAGPVAWRGFNNDERSLENMTLVNPPFGLEVTPKGHPRRGLAAVS